MVKRLLLIFWFLFWFDLAYSETSKPNVIFFAVDDMNDWITPLGSNRAKTPNLERLSKMGVTFKNAHTAGIYCAPSRAAIFTGKLASTSGCYQDHIYFYEHPEYIPLQVAFHDAGYNTYGVGKLYHHPEGGVDRRGWTEFKLRTEKQRMSGWPLDSWDHDAPLPSPVPHSKYNQIVRKERSNSFMEIGVLPNVSESEMADTIRTDWACEIIKQEHEKPFFIGLGLYAPHYPHYAPKKYYDLYPIDELELPPILESDSDDLSKYVKNKLNKRKGDIYDKLNQLGTYKHQLQAYLACISFADAMLGKVLDVLESSPNRDNTYLVFWSDHGYALGEKGHWGKKTLWKKTSQVPLLWAGPGIPKNRKSNQPVSLVDLYPTLLDLCRIPSDETFDGHSIKEVLEYPHLNHKNRVVVLPYDEPDAYALMDKNWRYIKNIDESEELYNNKLDPHEWYNLADIPEFKEVKDRLVRSAPKEFAAQGTITKELKLVIDGENFKWIAKSKDSNKK